MEPEHTPNPQRSRGIYGFVMYLFFVSFIIVYFAWLIIPADMAKSWTYEPPQKYWAIAVPIFLCTVLFLFAFCIYPAMCSSHDGKLNELNAIRDKYTVRNMSKNSGLEIAAYDFPAENLYLSKKPDKSFKNSCKSSRPSPKWKLYDETIPAGMVNKAIPPASDLDPLEVSKILYLRKKLK